MSARDDYVLAKEFLAKTDDPLPLVDRLRSLITSIRLEERRRVTEYGKHWVEVLEDSDEYAADLFKDFVDNVRTGVFAPPEGKPENDTDPLENAEPLEAIDERNL